MCNDRDNSQTNGPIISKDDEAFEDSSSDLASHVVDTPHQSLASSSTSVSSSIFNYRVENGRTYHKYKDGKYIYPNDPREIERLDLQHALCLMTLRNALGRAPPAAPGSNAKRVLDIGTGSGLWAIDFGEEHPETAVYGVDLSPVQPRACS
nr:methyltransferase domain-containing protein [Colletotrichum truncatum]KAF6792513.1 methyltransferase domain-containing protein [Colletotrichum truncatum]